MRPRTLLSRSESGTESNLLQVEQCARSPVFESEQRAVPQIHPPCAPLETIAGSPSLQFWPYRSHCAHHREIWLVKCPSEHCSHPAPRSLDLETSFADL